MFLLLWQSVLAFSEMYTPAKQHPQPLIPAPPPSLPPSLSLWPNSHVAGLLEQIDIHG